MQSPTHRQLHVLYIETYPSGSHGRVLDLLKSHSSHAITDIRLGRAHWKWLAIAAHYQVLEALAHLPNQKPPDILVLSGPLDVSGLVALLPAESRAVPRVVYFHESQWTYPSLEADPRPYVLQHLDAVATCNEAWFNSRYHLETFWDVATSTSSDERVRKLARRLRPQLEPRCRVVYPPVERTQPPRRTGQVCDRPRLLWNARWEMDKRPDHFIGLLDCLLDSGIAHDTLILGTGTTDQDSIREQLGRHVPHTTIPGHLHSRDRYEETLATADLFVSTADHEFFGIAALEAALAGVTPLVPFTLAYPETLPSAFFYDPGHIGDLAAIAAQLLTEPRAAMVSHQIDASRFIPERTVPLWDEHLERVANAESC